jgi:integrase
MAKRKFYQRPDGLFEAIRTINGKRVAFRGKTCREVEQKMMAYKEEAALGRTVKQIADAWLKDKEGRVSDGTAISYAQSIGKIVDSIGDMRAQHVKPIHCQRILEQLAGQGYKQGTVRMCKSVIVQLFRYAVMQGDIDISPATEIELPRGLPQKKREALTAEQIKQVTECRNGDWWLLGLALLWTGCRRGEMMALCYEDIDRKNGVIHITKQYNYSAANKYGKLEQHAKTSSGVRSIPLFSPLADALPRDRIGLIFHNEDGSHLTEGQVVVAWKKYIKAAGLPEHITPHYFRHTFATICYNAGVDPKQAAAIMGHSSERITMELYTHLSAEKKAAAADKIEAYAAKSIAGAV